jgi:hypothetical protein
MLVGSAPTTLYNVVVTTLYNVVVDDCLDIFTVFLTVENQFDV